MVKKNEVTKVISPSGERSETEGEIGKVENLRKNKKLNPEVSETAKRRTYRAEYKLRILEEVDRCKEGEVAALLRREGLYYSNVKMWQKQRMTGTLTGLNPANRGPKQKMVDPEYLRKVEKENERLRKKLKQAEEIIDIQKKIAAILGTGQNEDE